MQPPTVGAQQGRARAALVVGAGWTVEGRRALNSLAAAPLHPRRRAAPNTSTMPHEESFVVDDPLGLVRALEASDRFRRDSSLGRVFHLGKTSFREVSPTDSLHVIVDGNRVSAHVDRISPLAVAPAGPEPRYSPLRVLAHNLTGMAADLSRWIRGVHGHQRCNLDCEVVWVDDPSPAGHLHALPDIPAPEDRVPFTLVDEAVHLLDTEAAPWSIQLEVRVAGSLDEDRLRAALGTALAAHPMARARKVASRRTVRRDTWAIPDEPALDALRVVTCADDADLARTRAELQSQMVPLAESPPLRMRLARHPGGDVVMLNVNHAAMDGLGAVRLLHSVARAYDGRHDPLPAASFEESRELPARLARAGGRTRARRWLALAEKVRDLVASPARLAPEGGSDKAGYGFHHVALPPATTQALLADHRRGGTVNDVLVAALHLSMARWNAEHGAPCRRIGVLVPANLRPREWGHDVVGNLSLPARIATTRRSRRSPARALDAVVAQTRRKKASGMGTALLEVLGRSHLLPMWAKQAMVAMLPLTGNRLVDTAMLSNLGPLSDPPSFDEAGGTTEVWFSPPARMPLGLSVGAVTAAGRLHLSFRYRHRLFGPAAARRFADAFLAALGELAPIDRAPSAG